MVNSMTAQPIMNRRMHRFIQDYVEVYGHEPDFVAQMTHMRDTAQELQHTATNAESVAFFVNLANSAQAALDMHTTVTNKKAQAHNVFE